MGPATYALCKKPVIGAVMWITTLCAFPPLINHVPISLESAGISISEPFTAPVTKSYLFYLSFEFPSPEARLRDQVVGDNYSAACTGKIGFQDIPEKQRQGLGRPIPFKVVVRKRADRNGVVDQTLVSLCQFAHDGQSTKLRQIGWVDLQEGEYVAEVTNLEAQRSLESVKVFISLVSGGRK